MLLIGTLFYAYVFEWGSMCTHVLPCAGADPSEPPQM